MAAYIFLDEMEKDLKEVCASLRSTCGTVHHSQTKSEWRATLEFVDGSPYNGKHYTVTVVITAWRIMLTKRHAVEGVASEQFYVYITVYDYRAVESLKEMLLGAALKITLQ